MRAKGGQARRSALPTLALTALAVIFARAPARAAEPPTPPTAPPPVVPAPATSAPGPVAPPPVEPTRPSLSPADVAGPPAERVAPIPTADETPAPSDHDAVVHHVGVEARPFDPGPVPLALRPGFGCPAAQTTPCEITMGVLAARYWTTRNLAFNAGLAFAVGGGRQGTQALDTYFGAGSVVGLTLLLGNWRHLAVGASPELAVVWFRPGPSADIGAVTMINLRAALEAELHFGFVGVPALAVGIATGFAFQFESGSDTRVWSVGVMGAESVWGVLSNLFVRYYL
jgi:hypothetical protein